jgi:hypothetical protein
MEDALHAAIAIKRDVRMRGAKPCDEARAILEKHLINTLGTSLRIARESEVFDDELLVRLAIFKDVRDWLVHRSMRENGNDLHESDARSAVMYRVEGVGEEALVLQNATGNDLVEHVTAMVVSKDWI